ncbi:MAG: hypothetical protein CBC42_04670 [Betaproteobacteria bacterium TMED82]|nr:MAG: hypothetical protein CBC42_04670 [Betaproteobacteria bacterium TMED82]
MNFDILRIDGVKAKTGIARSTIYLRIEQGLLPKPFSIGGKSVGWLSDEIVRINAARTSGCSNEEIIGLVKKIELERKKFKKII